MMPVLRRSIPVPDLEETLLVVQKGCPHCKEARAILRDAIARGMIRLVDEHSTEGKKITDEYQIDGFPALLYRKESCLIFPDATIACPSGRTFDFGKNKKDAR